MGGLGMLAGRGEGWANRSLSKTIARKLNGHSQDHYHAALLAFLGILRARDGPGWVFGARVVFFAHDAIQVERASLLSKRQRPCRGRPSRRPVAVGGDSKKIEREKFRPDGG